MRGWVENSNHTVDSFLVSNEGMERIGGSLGGNSSAAEATILKHIDKLGWIHINNLSEDLRTIVIHINGVKDHLTIKINGNYPIGRPTLVTSLFPEQEYEWNDSNDLSYLYQLYSSSITRHSQYFEALSTLNQEACVALSKWTDIANELIQDGRSSKFLEPATAIRTVLVQVEPSVIYAELTISPNNALKQPDCKFYGPGVQHCDTLSKLWCEGKQKWSVDVSIARNMEVALGLVLPHPKDLIGTGNDGADNSNYVAPYITTCDICYGQGPEQFEPLTPHSLAQLGDSRVSCQNSKCHHMYHRECIREWLISGARCKVSFGVLFGMCPYCGCDIELPA